MRPVLDVAAIVAGKTHTLSVKGGGAIELKDVLLGEVWLCGGQSNMGRPVNGDDAEDGRLPADSPLQFVGRNAAPRGHGRRDRLGRLFARVAR